MSITTEQLAEWRALADAATPGPWLYRPNQFDDWGVVRGPIEYFVLQGFAGRCLTDEEASRHRAEKTDPYGNNARFAVASRTAVPALVAEVERLRAVLTELVAAHDVKGEAQHAGTQKAIVRACAREDRAWERARAALPEEPK